jgi:hypothetical protein
MTNPHLPPSSLYTSHSRCLYSNHI